jgi:predicted GNAT superfamily acetyltransferase
MTYSSTAEPVRPPREQPGIEIRTVRTHEEFDACVALQRTTWGRDYQDAVPASLLRICQMVGGLCAGAFDATGGLVGFVFGLTGHRDGQPIHWSHMLAVHPGYRDRGVGRRLKTFQREQVLRAGVAAMFWTFDPLVARNAHLNINRLGVRVVEYVSDMYAATGSELHAFGTDRFIVSWRADGTNEAPPAQASWHDAPLASEQSDGPVARIEVPHDVTRLTVQQARTWRAATRGQFVRLLHAGYEVRGFVRDGGRCFYVLERR